MGEKETNCETERSELRKYLNFPLEMAIKNLKNIAHTPDVDDLVDELSRWLRML